MRRVWVVGAGLIGLAVVAGCGNVRDLFSARPDVVAEVNGQTLSAQRLAEVMNNAQGVAPGPDAARFIANVWLDYASFGQSVAKGALKTDSASLATVLWAEITQLRVNRLHDTVLVRGAKVTDAALDSAYGGEQRVLQHILIGVPQGADAATKDAARRKVDSLLAVVKGGGDFAAVARDNSQDPSSAVQGGLLPPVGKGAFVPPFEKAGWALAPGGISGVVETQFGFHILRRPPLAEVAPKLRLALAQQQARTVDSTWLAGIAAGKKFEVQPDAPAALKTAVADPDGQRKSTKQLVKYTGGALTVGEAVRWLAALPPQFGGQLAQAPDSDLVQFAKGLAQQVVLVQQADSAGITITADEWTQMSKNLVGQLDALKQEVGLDVPEVTDPKRPEGERTKAAGEKTAAYFDKLVSGQVQLRPIPAALTSLLREQNGARLNPAGIARAVELAQGMRAKADSAAPKPGALQPAPGGPPVPGGAPADSARPPAGAAPGEQPKQP